MPAALSVPPLELPVPVVLPVPLVPLVPLVPEEEPAPSAFSKDVMLLVAELVLLVVVMTILTFR
ncbi:hypothetical protein DYGSA30_43100 [Dyella sp. GSA-30]|nr:hypothetical protein DYGSA30_43100 [Dyella sp. GSA-30]